MLVTLQRGRPERAEEVVWKTTRFLPTKWHSRIGRWTANFVEGLGAFRATKSFVRVAWTSVAIWLADFGMYVVLGKGFGVGLRAGGYFLLEGVGNLALGVPATAAGLGSFDYLTLISAEGLGVPKNVDAAYVLTVHAFAVIPVTILGAIFLFWAFPRAFRPWRRGQEHQQPVQEPVQEVYKEA